MDIAKQYSHLSCVQHAQIIQEIERVRKCDEENGKATLARNLIDFLWQLEQYGFITGPERVRYMDALHVSGVKKGKAGVSGVKVQK